MQRLIFTPIFFASVYQLNKEGTTAYTSIQAIVNTMGFSNIHMPNPPQL